MVFGLDILTKAVCRSLVRGSPFACFDFRPSFVIIFIHDGINCTLWKLTKIENLMNGNELFSTVGARVFSFRDDATPGNGFHEFVFGQSRWTPRVIIKKRFLSQITRSWRISLRIVLFLSNLSNFLGEISFFIHFLFRFVFLDAERSENVMVLQ